MSLTKAESLAALIADMESDIHEMVGLAAAVRIMGDRSSSQDVDGNAVYAVGTVLEAVADRIKDGWNDVFKLSRPNGT